MKRLLILSLTALPALAAALATTAIATSTTAEAAGQRFRFPAGTIKAPPAVTNPATIRVPHGNASAGNAPGGVAIVNRPRW